MNREIVIEQLQCYRYIIAHIKALQEEENELRNMCESLGNSIGDGMPHGSSSGDAKYTKLVNKIVDLQCEREEEIERLTAEQEKLTQLINLAPTPKGREILTMQYRHGWSTTRIANEVGRSDRNIRGIRNRAINHIADTLSV